MIYYNVVYNFSFISAYEFKYLWSTCLYTTYKHCYSMCVLLWPFVWVYILFVEERKIVFFQTTICWYLQFHFCDHWNLWFQYTKLSLKGYCGNCCQWHLERQRARVQVLSFLNIGALIYLKGFFVQLRLEEKCVQNEL